VVIRLVLDGNSIMLFIRSIAHVMHKGADNYWTESQYAIIYHQYTETLGLKRFWRLCLHLERKKACTSISPRINQIWTSDSQIATSSHSKSIVLLSELCCFTLGFGYYYVFSLTTVAQPDPNPKKIYGSQPLTNPYIGWSYGSQPLTCPPSVF